MDFRTFMMNSIKTHEGGLSLRAADHGNWYKGQLIGSKYGVTGAALAEHLDRTNITAKDIVNLTVETAADIAAKSYIKAPGFDKMPVDRVVFSVIDKGWMSGPSQAIKLLQRLVGVDDDGQLGPATIAAYKKWKASLGEEEAARRWGDTRIKFDTLLTIVRPANKVFLNGWNNRTKAFLPGTKWWAANA